MPELPEVETIRKELEHCITGLSIESMTQLYPGTLINKIPSNECLSQITSINRLGKFLDICLKNSNHIIIHLRMTGKLIFSDTIPEVHHLRAYFTLSQNKYLLFDDVRTFGKIICCHSPTEIKTIANLGPEPLSKEFNFKYYKSKSQSRSVSIKVLLLDQNFVAGLGNIYVQEALFDAKINPQKKAGSLTDTEIKRLIRSVQKIINLALQHNGTTISDFRRVDDKTGEFQNFLKVYGKESCPKCGQKLSVIKQTGRTTRFCSNCQK